VSDFRAICRHCGGVIRLETWACAEPYWHHNDGDGSISCLSLDREIESEDDARVAHCVAEPVIPRFRIYSRPEMTELPAPEIASALTPNATLVANDVLSALTSADLDKLQLRAWVSVGTFRTSLDENGPTQYSAVSRFHMKVAQCWIAALAEVKGAANEVES
jgi:hypothetical protein